MGKSAEESRHDTLDGIVPLLRLLSDHEDELPDG